MSDSKKLAGYVKYPKPSLKKEPPKPAKKTPSQYQREVGLTTAQFLATLPLERKPARILEFYNLNDTSSHPECIVDVDEPIFQPFPPEISFQAFEPFQTYEMPLFFRNNDNVARRLKVLNPESRFFSLKCTSAIPPSKVAPGMEVSFVVRFTPEERTDYSCDIICVTEREKFVVPIKAIGARAFLDFPDEVVFESAPVKHTSQKTLYIRNMGESSTDISMRIAEPFSVEPRECHVGVGEAVQISLSFTPNRSARCSADLEVSYDGAESVFTHVWGVGEDVNVRLDTQTMQMPDTFITLVSQRRCKLFNRSDVKVKYEWKFYSTAEEDEAVRGRRSTLLSQQESEERSMLTSSGEELSAETARETAAVTRKYKKLRRDLETDHMLFQDEVFRIEPLSGEVWPNSEAEFIISFCPRLAAECASIAFLDVTGRESRLPLQLNGRGIGPKVSFSFDVVELGDVFINSMHQYTVNLQNEGSIDGPFELIQPTSLFGPKFKFTPSKGVVRSGQSVPIQVSFCSDILGMFNEDFFWAVQGASDPVMLHFAGSVIGPTFEFDTESIKFGHVSCNFPAPYALTLYNTSEIPMHFQLHVPEDNGLTKEFEIVPSSGTILPHGKQRIQVELTAQYVREYHCHLGMEVEGMGEDVASIPIEARSVVPEIGLLRDLVEFDDCFVGYPYNTSISLENETTLPAKYEIVLPPDDEIYRRALVQIEDLKGVVPARNILHIPVTFIPQVLGPIHTMVYVKILGSERPPFSVSITAKAIGPIVELDQTSIDFGKVNVLEKVTRTLRIANRSPIPALFSAFVESKTASVFSLAAEEGEIPPSSPFDLVISGYLDELIKFSETLKLSITNGRDFDVPLTGLGKGCTLVPSIPIAEPIRFGNQFTNQPCSKTFTIENHGRKAQSMSWVVEKIGRKKPSNAEEKRQMELNDPIIFHVAPEKCVLPPKSSADFTIDGLCAKPGPIVEKIVLRSAVSGHSTAPVFEFEVQAEFNVPLLEFSKPSLFFDYTYESTKPPATQSQPLTVKNVSPLPLTALLKSQAPFSLDVSDFTLASGESITVNVVFDPNYKSDMVSHKVKTKLLITYREHPQKDSFELSADINFPNVAFDSPNIDFGCILNDTERRMFLTMTNVSKVDCVYEWAFEDRPEGLTRPPSRPSSRASQKSTDSVMTVGPPVAPNKAFDILPVRGVLKPGESEQIQFVFYGQSNSKQRAMAFCQVTGGPEYEVGLAGESSGIQFKLDRSSVDFGAVSYSKTEESEVFIQNSGKVGYNFTVDLSQLSRPGVVEVTPMTGRIQANDRVRLAIKFTPGIPDRVSETFFVQVAHFEPAPVRVFGIGLFPTIGLSLPRQPNPDFSNFIEVSRLSLVQSLPDPDSYHRVAASIIGSAAQSRKKVPSPQPGQARTGETPQPGAESGALSPANTPPLPLEDPEAEAERLFFTKFLSEQFALTSVDVAAATPATKRGESRTTEKPASAVPAKKVSAKKFVVATYICDLGNVVRSLSKKRTFKLSNTGYLPVSFSFDKKALQGTGFSIEPDKVNKLPGFPNNQDCSFDVVFNSKSLKNAATALGPCTALLPIEVKNGASVHVLLSANIVVPEVEVSVERLDFDRVVVGQCRVVYFQLNNRKEVPCEWSVKKEVGRDSAAFECSPDKGLLQPGERCNVAVTFTPLESRPFSMQLLVKVNYNSRNRPIACRGQGDDIKLRLEPPVVECHPVLPNQTSDCILNITNDTDYAVEIFSLDFDPKYLEEEDILRNVPGFVSDVLLAAPRAAGDPLQKEIVEAFETNQKRLLELQQTQEVAAASSKSFAGHHHLQPSTSVANSPEPHGSTPIPGEAVGDLVTSQDVIQRGRGTVVVVHGPPCSGKTTQANMIGQRYGLPVLSLEGMLHDYMDKGPEDEIMNFVRMQFDSAEFPELPSEILAVVFYHRLQMKDCINGCVIDGLYSELLPNPEANAVALLMACPPKRLRLCTLNQDLLTTFQKNLVAVEAKAIALTESSKVREITEDEYEAMSREEQADYAQQLRAYKLRARELAEIRKQTVKPEMVQNIESEIASEIERRQATIVEIEKVKALIQEREEKEKETATSAAKDKKKPPAPAKLDPKGAPPVLQVPVLEKIYLSARPEEDPVAHKYRVFRLTSSNIVELFRKAPNVIPSETPGFGNGWNYPPNVRPLSRQLAGGVRSSTSSIAGLSQDAFATALSSSLDSIRTQQAQQKVLNAERFGVRAEPSPPSVSGSVLSEGSAKEEPTTTAAAATTAQPTLTDDTDGFACDADAHADSESIFSTFCAIVPVDKAIEVPKEIILPIPDPLTRQRLVRPPKRKPREPIRNFKILTPEFAVVTIPRPGSARLSRPASRSGLSDGGQSARTMETVRSNPVASPPPPPAGTSPSPQPPISATSPSPVPSFISGATSPSPVPMAPAANGFPTVTSGAGGLDANVILGEHWSDGNARWVIPANSVLRLVVRFSSEEKGRIERTLQFGVVGRTHEYSVQVKAICSYPEISQDYRNVFYRKVKTRTEDRFVHRQFVISKKVFEFGPLLTGKPRENYSQGNPQTLDNCERFRITNNGLFDAQIDFCFESEETGPTPTFLMHPQSMMLRRDETQEITIWAFPERVGAIENALICLIKDNPEPVRFALSCVGAKPQIKVDTDKLDFGRLLLTRSDTKCITVKNTSTIPVQFRMAGVETLESEFAIDPVQGIVEAGSESVIKTTFKPENATSFAKKLTLEVSDVKGVKGIAQSIPISIAAEAFQVQVDIADDLDFDVVRVSEGGKKQITMLNRGKYDVGFRFVFAKKKLEDTFRTTPMEGVLKAGDKKPTLVDVVFKTKGEIALKDITDMACHILDPKTNELVGRIPIKISARAVFSKYSVVPLHGINFGPLLNGVKKTRTFDITNQGEFDFRFALFSLKDSTPPAFPPRSESVASEAAKKDKKGAATSDGSGPPITLTKFVITPGSGIVPRGATQTITVQFNAEGSALYQESLGIEISDRDPNGPDGGNGIPFELEGESCVPGINTSDYESIFEEQQVVSRLDVFNQQGPVFAADERVFSYGAIIAGQQIQEKFKISNPQKIPCDVLLSVKMRDSTDDPAFDIQPQKMFLPAHEHRYVTVTFSPSSLKSYSATFNAVVENGQDPKTRDMTFELRGEGTLPQVSIERPAERDASGPILRFARTILGKSQQLSIVLRNDGILPATVRFDFPHHPAFAFLARGQEVTIDSKKTETLAMEFHPSEIGKVSAKMRMTVFHNKFEDTMISVEGEGYVEDVTFEDLPEDKRDELALKDCYLGVRKQASFTLCNHTQDPMRFDWTLLEGITVSPAIGHIQPKSTKDVTVAFLSSAPRTYGPKAEAISCNLTKIRYTGEARDWDDRAKSLRYEEEEEDGAVTARKVNKIVEPEPEPQHEPLPSSLQKKPLKITLNCDCVKFQCPTTPIQFKTTLMFQTRSFTFPLKNIGTVSMPFTFQVVDQASGARDPDGPFAISPATGTLPAGETTTVTVRYSPLDVEDHNRTILCEIPYLPSDVTCPQIPVFGRSQCPLVHFELLDSNYVSSGRRNPELPGPGGKFVPLDPATRVLEFESRGIKIKNTKRFYVLNPSAISYEFSWESDELSRASPFRCLSTGGVIHSGKKFEMVFEYTADSLDFKESFWRFKVPEHGVDVPFLLVGHAVEPEVLMDKTRLNFNSVLLGARAKETVNIINRELVPFSFAFDLSTFSSPNETPVLDISPYTGTVGPESSLPVTISFLPNKEDNFNYNLVCNVRKKPTKLSLNVKGEGYMIHAKLESENDVGQRFELSPDTPNVLDFGRTHVNERQVKRISVVNSGKFNVDFKFSTSSPNRFFSITPEIGSVAKGEKVEVELVFNPTSECILESKLVCKITNGPSYVLNVVGRGTQPQLEFSFRKFDFGPCFLYNPSVPTAQTVLVISNNDSNDVSCDVQYESKPHLEVRASATVLRPKERREVVILFTPREVKSYRELISFEINSLYTVNVEITGEGTPARVELVNPAQQSITFGALRIGDSARKTLKLLNRSKISASFRIAPECVARLERHSIKVSHADSEEVLRPREQGAVELIFSPQLRTNPFSEELVLIFAGLPRTIASVSGACQGVEVKLDTKGLAFGPVVINTSVTRRVVLENTGDVGVKFRWDQAKMEPDFTVSPVEGYVGSNSDVSFDVTFKPTTLKKDVQYEQVPLFIEGLPKPLSIGLSGMCVEKPPEAEVLKFRTNVRTESKKTVTIKNSTSTDWVLKPVIDLDAWAGLDKFEVPAGQTKPYEITYRPLFMTGPRGQQDKGSLFFPLPDGTAILYSLIGDADEPLAAGTVNQDLPAKTLHTQHLTVSNWLKTPQRFKVSLDLLPQDDSVVIRGLDSIDVPASAQREYKFTYLAYKEGIVKGKVTFTNPETKEFLFYNVQYKNTKAEDVQSVSLETAVRQRAAHSIRVENPLDKPITFTVKSTQPELTAPPTITVPPRSEGICEVDFLPVVARESSAKVTLESPELGEFPYKFDLRSTPPLPEKPQTFKVPLGGTQSQTLRFVHYSKTNTEFTCKLSAPDFALKSPTIKAPAAAKEGTELTLDITYEPAAIGDTRDILVVSSAVGGEYIFPIVGHCVAPKPQGPIDIKASGSATVAFKNVFSAPTVYSFTVDNPAFSVKPNESIGPKKATNIAVSYKPATPGATTLGKLTISCPNAPSWVYYLRGKPT